MKGKRNAGGPTVMITTIKQIADFTKNDKDKN